MKPSITHRQQEVLALMAQGYTNVQIAARLELAEQSVKNTASTAFRRLHVHNRTGAYIALGWLKVPR